MAIVTWASAVSGDWSTAGDWNTDTVPGPADDVRIGSFGSYSVTISQAEMAAALRLGDPGATLNVDAPLTLGRLRASAGTLALGQGQTLSVDGNAQLGRDHGAIPVVSGQGTLLTSGRSVVGGYTEQASPVLSLSDGATWLNTGTVVDNGSIAFSSSSDATTTLDNAAGGTFGMTYNLMIGDPSSPSTAQVDNAGTLFGEFSFGQYQIDANFDNTGTIKLVRPLYTNVGSTLTLVGGGTIGGTILNLGDSESVDGAVVFAGGTYLLHAVVRSFIDVTAGTVDLAARVIGLVNVYDGATVVVVQPSTLGGGKDPFLGGFDLLGGTLAIQADETLNAKGGLSVGSYTSNLTSTLEGSGTLIADGGTVEVGYNFPGLRIVGPSTGEGPTWINTGTMEILSDIVIGDGTVDTTATIVNTAGAFFGGDIISAEKGDKSYFDNLGDVTSSGTIDSILHNTGTVVVTGQFLFLASLTNLSGTTLTGGSYEIGSFHRGFSTQATIELADNRLIVTDAADIVLIGSGSTIQALDTTTKLQVGIDATLATIAEGGTLRLEDGQSFVAGAATLTDDGALRVTSGASFLGGALAIGATGTLFGNGTVAAAVQQEGQIVANNGTLTLTGAISGGGTLTASAGAVLALNGGGTLAAVLAGPGTVEIGGAAALTLAPGVSLDVASLLQQGDVTLGTGSGAVSLTVAAGQSYTMTGQASLTGVAGSALINDGTVAASGTDTIGVAFIDQGSVGVSAGTLSFTGAVTENGTITTAASLIYGQSVDGAGTVAIGAGGVAEFLGGSSNTLVAAFLPTFGTLDLGNPVAFAGSIGGFAPGDTIDLIDTPATGHSFAGGVLTVADHGATVTSLHFAGSYTNADFAFASDGHGGTLITHA